MSYTLHLEIPGLPKTMNARMHWRVRAKVAKEWRALVVYYAKSKRPPSPLKFAKIRYTRVSAHPLDFDNLVSSFKHVQDGLIDAGIIENDAYANIGAPEVRWSKGQRNKGYIRVEVEALANSPEQESDSGQDAQQAAQGA